MAKIAANTFFPAAIRRGRPLRRPRRPPPARPPTPTPCGTWNIVPSANVPTRRNSLQGVAVVSATDIWAVGYTYRQ